jgi:hypothetical protein
MHFLHNLVQALDKGILAPETEEQVRAKIKTMLVMTVTKLGKGEMDEELVQGVEDAASCILVLFQHGIYITDALFYKYLRNCFNSRCVCLSPYCKHWQAQTSKSLSGDNNSMQLFWTNIDNACRQRLRNPARPSQLTHSPFTRHISTP